MKLIARRVLLALAVGKQALNRHADEGYGHGIEAITLLQGSADVQEGITAFREGREPRFEDGDGMASSDDEAVGVTPVQDLERRAAALAMGGPERIARHHASGRLTARERIELLVDAGSWTEFGLLAEPELRRPELAAADAVVTGFARVGGRNVAIIAVDATVLAGTTSPVNMRKQNRVAEWAGRRGLPLICLADNDGGRLPDILGWRFTTVAFDFSTFLQPPAGRPQIPRVTAVLGASFGDRRCTPRWVTSS